MTYKTIMNTTTTAQATPMMQALFLHVFVDPAPELCELLPVPAPRLREADFSSMDDELDRGVKNGSAET